MPVSSASWTSTSKPTRRPASLPETRARLPASRRSPSRSSTSNGTGAQRAAASGSVSTSSTASGWAAAVVVAVHVLMTATVPAAASRVVGLPDDLARGAADDPGSSSRMTRGWSARRTMTRAARTYALGMQLLRALRARVRAMDPRASTLLIAAGVPGRGASSRSLLLVGDAEHAWLAALAHGRDRGRRSRCAAARRSPRWSLALRRRSSPSSRSAARSTTTSTAPFFAVLFVLFSFGLHERDGRRAARRASRSCSPRDASAQRDRRLPEHRHRPASSAALVIAGGPILLGRVIAQPLAAQRDAAREGRAAAPRARRRRPSRRPPRSAPGSRASCTTSSRTR